MKIGDFFSTVGYNISWTFSPLFFRLLTKFSVRLVSTVFVVLFVANGRQTGATGGDVKRCPLLQQFLHSATNCPHPVVNTQNRSTGINFNNNILKFEQITIQARSTQKLSPTQWSTLKTDPRQLISTTTFRNLDK